MQPIDLIVGLANPGPEYEQTRHNAGAWLLESLAAKHQGRWQSQAKFQGLTCQINLANHPVKLLIPTTYMNHSGHAISAMAQFYKIPAERILVVHDELDLAPGEIRFKLDGGHGGHNGLRSTIQSLGNQHQFKRLRLGIGHPGHKSQVVSYVLKPPSAEERGKIDQAIDEALKALPEIIAGEHQKAMKQLHSFSTT